MNRVALAFAILISSILLFGDSKKKIDELGLDLISKVKFEWKTVRCNDWPEKDLGYHCSGDFYVYPNGIKVDKNVKR